MSKSLHSKSLRSWRARKVKDLLDEDREKQDEKSLRDSVDVSSLIDKGREDLLLAVFGDSHQKAIEKGKEKQYKLNKRSFYKDAASRIPRVNQLPPVKEESKAARKLVFPPTPVKHPPPARVTRVNPSLDDSYIPVFNSPIYPIFEEEEPLTSSVSHVPERSLLPPFEERLTSRTLMRLPKDELKAIAEEILGSVDDTHTKKRITAEILKEQRARLRSTAPTLGNGLRRMTKREKLELSNNELGSSNTSRRLKSYVRSFNH